MVRMSPDVPNAAQVTDLVCSLLEMGWPAGTPREDWLSGVGCSPLRAVMPGLWEFELRWPGCTGTWWSSDDEQVLTLYPYQAQPTDVAALHASYDALSRTLSAVCGLPEESAAAASSGPRADWLIGDRFVELAGYWKHGVIGVVAVSLGSRHG